MSEGKEWNFTFVWKIENYLSCDSEFQEEITSPIFTIETPRRSNWSLIFYPKGCDEEYKDYVSCYLQRNDDELSAENITVSYDIKLNNAVEENLEHARTKYQTFKPNESWGFSALTRINQIIEEMNSCIQDTLIVFCYINIKDEKRRIEKYCESRTIISVSRSSFIRRLFKNDLNVEKKYYFYLETQLYEIRISIPQDKAIIVVSEIRGESCDPHRVVGKITLFDPKGNAIISRRDSHLFSAEEDSGAWEFPSFITRKQLQYGKQVCEEDGSYELLFEFSASGYAIENSVVQAYDTFTNVDSILKLRCDLKHLLLDERFSDVKLRINNTVLPAHKSLLATRSPVFSAMFKQDMIENQTGVVDIADVEVDTLKSFLEFVYTGLVSDLDKEIALKLLVVADKYQVDTLIEKCALFLMSILSTENVGDILTVSDLIRHNRLKTAVFRFIGRNAEKIFKSSEWSKWIKENGRFSAEIFAYLGNNLEMTPKE